MASRFCAYLYYVDLGLGLRMELKWNGRVNFHNEGQSWLCFCTRSSDYVFEYQLTADSPSGRENSQFEPFVPRLSTGTTGYELWNWLKESALPIDGFVMLTRAKIVGQPPVYRLPRYYGIKNNQLTS